ncbi:GbsR/MarR family transcriptional regulator [Nocardia panacis]|uniref:GbsR/MarR family transcriptional regulator n=1 Tax=Nocardia panacis TaxID=2340916 RepID=UPI0019397B4C|nr:helix-turn-helix domain-containing protein [Nocardia panacis]
MPMPGGRLTHTDRRRIAAWLADGLGYADSADRPRRSVARSHATAHSSTTWPSPRSRPQAIAPAAANRPRPAASAIDGQSTEAAREFVNRFAALLAATGMPGMTARVFVCLLTADAAGLTAADLVRELRVIPASVSKSIGYLEAMELVVRQPDSGGRRERYRMDDDVWLRAWQADTGAHGEIAIAAQRGIEIFGTDTTPGARLAEMGRFFARISEQMRGSGRAETVGSDALTVLAALLHAARPLPLTELATALDWPRARAIAALDAIERQPAIADPLALRTLGFETYTLTTRSDRLSPIQRQALQK